MEGAQFYRKLLDSIADGVYFVDLQRRITFWNKGAERLSGYTAQEVIGKSCADSILRHVDASGRELCLTGCPLAAVVQDGRMRTAQVFMHHKLGYRVPVDVRATAMRAGDGRIMGAVEIFHKTEEALDVLAEIEKLRREVLTDPLTGVGNRRYADVRLADGEKDAREFGVPFGVLFVDIDHFKAVNDTWGHGVGDKVLRMVAAALTNGVRALDAVCRWGGEEFVVITRNVSHSGLHALGERLRVLIAHSWIEHGPHKIAVTASFGGAMSRPGETAEEVLRRADAQLYRSKAEGRNRVCVDPS